MHTLHGVDKPTWRNNAYLKAFLVGLGLSCLVFIPFILVDRGYFLFYGDFNVQQVPFYQIAHDAIRSGNLGWNRLTDLGANFIGSYSFYLLGSPFFWLTLPFPNEMLPHLMGPLLILKFACATLTAYIYLRRYVKNQNTALIGAILYAFSGFSTYNVFFNHFHEAIICFPLMLAALDAYMYHRRRGVFALAVAFCCMTNYYFFVGQVTFALIYFFLRLLCKSWRISLRDFLYLLLEAVLGVGMACILLLPSALAVLQNERTNNIISGWNAVLYNKNQRYVHILQAMFFPPDLPARPNFTPDSESKWASLGAWLPLFGMTGVIGWLQIRRKHWLKKMLWILLVMAMIPGLNAAFQLFNGSFYARWYYMLTLMFSLATVLALEYQPVNWRRSIKWSLLLTGAMAAVIGLMPTVTKDEKLDEKTVSFGLMKYPTRFWTYVAIALVCIALTVYLFQFCNADKRQFNRSTAILLSITAVLYSVYFIALGKTQSSSPSDHIIPYAINGGDKIKLDGFRDDGVRVDFYESMDNSAMFWKVESIQAFHSIVPGSVMSFYEKIGVQRDVASRPKTEHYALRGLTSVRWLFDDEDDDEDFRGEDEKAAPKMPGWLYYGNQNGFEIWENERYIPMGFCYDFFVTEATLDSVVESNREQLMLKALVIDNDAKERISQILSPFEMDQAVYSKEAYFADCQMRARSSCEVFRYTNTGFYAELSAEKETLVFFSVPIEDGWSATVNGVDTEIVRANVGFMAVPVPQGEKVVIEFTYRTPGLASGAAISLVCVLAFLAYLVLTRRADSQRKARKMHRQIGLQPEKFELYCMRRNATFTRPLGMQPKEMRLPPPPEMPALSVEREGKLE